MATKTTTSTVNRHEHSGSRLSHRAQELFHGLTENARVAEAHIIDELIKHLEDYKKTIPNGVQKKDSRPPVLEDWDAGVFFNEVERISSVKDETIVIKQPLQGTYNGTKRSLSQMFERIEER